MNVVIVGGGRIGFALARNLTLNRHNVVVIERDPQVCERLVKELNVIVINGDGTNLQTLRDAELDKADVLVALSGRDQDNLVVCQLASLHFNVPRTIARVTNPKNQALFEKLGGVSIAVSTTHIISSLIEENVSIEDVVTLFPFRGGEVVLVQTEVGAGSPAKGRRIVDLHLPDECIIISIKRGGKVIFPRGQTVIEEGDKIFALTTEQRKRMLQDIF